MKARYILALLILLALAFGVDFAFKNLRGALPAITSPRADIAEIIDSQPPEITESPDFPLGLPPGFKISIFARDLPGARVMAFDSSGNLWVSQTKEGAVSLVEIKDRAVIRQRQVFANLDRPHGLAFDPEDANALYIAEESRVSRARVDFGTEPEQLFDLPSGKGHFTRTIIFNDSRLFTSIGSSCNACEESDERRAKILASEKDGANLRSYAAGLRNSVFMAVNPETGEIWASENGRDLLGDDVPPDEINIIREGRNYGWPVCFGKNIRDPEAETSLACDGMEASRIDLQAHSAPLGLAFVPESAGWPGEYRNDLIVAYHGSWNRSVPTGYKLVRLKLDSQGQYLGTEDFITGWLDGRSALGRPVDVLFAPDGSMYVSDDHAGVIYKVIYEAQDL